MQIRNKKNIKITKQMERAEIKEAKKREKKCLILFQKIIKGRRPSYDYFLPDNLLSFLNWKDPFLCSLIL